MTQDTIYKILWSSEAQEDMDELYLFYAKNNPLAASNIHNAILDEVEYLQKHPQLGAIEDALSNRPKQYRSLVISKGKFKAIYFIENKTIFITHIWNCKQNPKKLQERPL